jgi:hypothetical protein
MRDTRQDSHAVCVPSLPVLGLSTSRFLLPQLWGQDRPQWHALMRTPLTGAGDAVTHRGGDGLVRGRSGRSGPVRGLPRTFSPLEREWTRLQPLSPT